MHWYTRFWGGLGLAKLREQKSKKIRNLVNPSSGANLERSNPTKKDGSSTKRPPPKKPKHTKERKSNKEGRKKVDPKPPAHTGAAPVGGVPKEGGGRGLKLDPKQAGNSGKGKDKSQKGGKVGGAKDRGQPRMSEASGPPRDGHASHQPTVPSSGTFLSSNSSHPIHPPHTPAQRGPHFIQSPPAADGVSVNVVSSHVIPPIHPPKSHSADFPAGARRVESVDEDRQFTRPPTIPPAAQATTPAVVRPLLELAPPTHQLVYLDLDGRTQVATLQQQAPRLPPAPFSTLQPFHHADRPPRW